MAKSCRRGTTKSGRCKRKPGPKRRSKSKSRRSRKCKHGRKKTKRRGCKKKSGPKRKRRRSKRKNRMTSTACVEEYNRGRSDQQIADMFKQKINMQVKGAR